MWSNSVPTGHSRRDLGLGHSQVYPLIRLEPIPRYRARGVDVREVAAFSKRCHSAEATFLTAP
jgi:hypothetical protein